jgi:hypothetical protein
MAHGDTTDTDGAAARLHELSTYFREHPVNGPAGHSYISSEPRPTAVAATLPFNAGVTDHITASLREVAEHTRAVDPDAGPLPERVSDAYAWMREHTEHAPEIEQQRAEAIEFRHWLEHCLRAGDHETVRSQARQYTCPACGCWGLMWSKELRVILCSNWECLNRDGTSTTLTLARLAHMHVEARQKVRHARAT